ncbi:type IV secretory system conjugative DNA transfer family protein, partial [Corynebacterium sp. AOP12-C2-36]|uniref:type IV secretory system conjugative DNA transfer family protein n=1 Tax=Corynebacterium sp. AOP12-C2-36 TaxID=3457723 RepID=UPI004033B0E5
EIWPDVRSREEAARNFDNIAITVGLGASGPIAFPPKLFPHRELTGSTGGGKSVSARAEIMQYLAFGYRIFAVDGKNTDYASFFRVPNFSAISTTLHEHIIVIHMVAQILQSRRRTASASAKQGDNSWRDELTPILLVLDEWASVRSQMKSMLKPKEMQLIDNDLVNILKVGREFRVNVLLATQDMKADTVPSDWQDMFIAVASAGKPAPMTVRKAFPEEIQGKVTRIGGTISRKTPGRSLISVVDEETGAANAELYQAFWSYSPAETINEKLPAEVRGNWTQFKDCVVDQIPQLYPRQWVKLEYPQYTEKDPYKELRENEEVWVDITKMSVEDLHKLRPVALENRNNGFEYIEENAKYDPLSELYLGQEPLDGENGSLT